MSNENAAAANTITLHDSNGTAYEAAFCTIVEHDGASIGRAYGEIDREFFHVPAVVFRCGTVISRRDWEERHMEDDEIVEEASDPEWAHHWRGPRGEPIVIFGGLPRILG